MKVLVTNSINDNKLDLTNSPGINISKHIVYYKCIYFVWIVMLKKYMWSMLMDAILGSMSSNSLALQTLKEAQF